MAEPAPSPVPEGMSTITTHLWFNGNCSDALDFYQKAFGAELAAPAVPAPGGNGVLHAMMSIGSSKIMMADAFPGSWERGPDGNATAGLFFYVDDCDALHQRAVEAGCEEIGPMADMFWGDRAGKVKDPYGHCWAIATHKWLYTDEEIEQGQQEWLQSIGGSS